MSDDKPTDQKSFDEAAGGADRGEPDGDLAAPCKVRLRAWVAVHVIVDHVPEIGIAVLRRLAGPGQDVGYESDLRIIDP